MTIGLNKSLGDFRRFNQKPFHHSLVRETDKKKKEEEGNGKWLRSRPSVSMLCANSGTDQWAGLFCECVPCECVSRFLNSSSVRQLGHTWLRRFRQPQRSITAAKSLMSCCTALQYLNPQAALLCTYVRSEHPQSSGEPNKKEPRPRKVFWHLWAWTLRIGSRFEGVMCLRVMSVR